MKSKYSLRFLPMFEDDLGKIIDYIAFELKNPSAAEALVDAVEKAIYERLYCPEAFAPYPTLRRHEHKYYYIPVKNYLVFYVVIGDVMEVRRIVYSRRNIQNTI